MKWIILALVALGFLIIALSAEAECRLISVFDSDTGQTHWVTECDTTQPTLPALTAPPDFTRVPVPAPIYVPAPIPYPDCSRIDCE